MTTIAWDGKTLAADTLVTAGGERAGYAVKIRRIGSMLYASSGSCGLGDRWEAWLRAGAQGDPPEMKQGDNVANGYVFLPGRVVWFHEDGATAIKTNRWAAGSGGNFALGAMAFGASAEEAVRTAIEIDTGSGGEITVLSPARA